jgi:hypothetical protein
MTYRGMLMIILAVLLVWLGYLVVGAQPGSSASQTVATAREIIASTVTPAVGDMPVNQAYVTGDGTLYFVGNGSNALVRDTDGNLRTLPVSKIPH